MIISVYQYSLDALNIYIYIYMCTHSSVCMHIQITFNSIIITLYFIYLEQRNYNSKNVHKGILLLNYKGTPCCIIPMGLG